MLVKSSKRTIIGFIVFLCIFMVSCSTQIKLVNSTVLQLPENTEPFGKKLFVEKSEGEEKNSFKGLWSVENVIEFSDIRKTI